MHSATASFPQICWHYNYFFLCVLVFFFFFYCFIYLFILTTDHSPGSKSNCRKELSVLLTTVQKKPQTEEQISPPRAGLQGTAHPELPSRSNTVFTPASRRDRALGQPRCANLSAVTETLERYECFLEAHQEEVWNVSCTLTVATSCAWQICHCHIMHVSEHVQVGAGVLRWSGNKNKNTVPHTGFVCARYHGHLSSGWVLI